MKKTTFLLSALVMLLMGSVSCANSEKKAWDKKNDDTVKTEATKAPAMNEIQPVAKEDPEKEINQYKESANYRKLMLIAAKCDDPDFSLNDLSQSDYKFMIDFVNMMMDCAEEADLNNEGDQFLNDTKEFQEILEGFSTFLAMAYQEGLLDSSNSRDFELLMRRANTLSNS